MYLLIYESIGHGQPQIGGRVNEYLVSLRVEIFFFAFLDDLGNFKHFEPYLFIVKKLVAP